MSYNEERAHAGHRERMRAKFAEHGARIFDTYELLEMLLYYTVPVRDTNPMAKRLLAEAGGLDALLAAPRERLAACGVGERTAELIFRTGALSRPAMNEGEASAAPELNVQSLGSFIAARHAAEGFGGISLTALDNKLSPLCFKKLSPLDLASGAVAPKLFIDAALGAGASACAVAHCHAGGPLFPSGGDVETVRALKSALASVGVRLAESFVIVGDSFIGMLSGARGARKGTEEIHTGASVTELAPLLKAALGTEAEQAKPLLDIPTRSALFSTEQHRLAELGGAEAALLVRLAAALAARRITDAVRFGAAYSEAELVPYIRALFLDECNEAVFALSLDGRGRLTAADRVADGTVNASEILPRKLVETAKRRKAAALILAHNHPRGTATPSEDDASATRALTALLAEAGIALTAHYVVGECDTGRIAPTDIQ